MSTLITSRKYGQSECAVGVDTAFLGVTLPSESTLHGVNIDLHIISNAAVGRLKALVYRVEGFILPLVDPDNEVTMQTLWNALVPKVDDTDTIDLDTVAGVGQTAFEPGETSFNEVLNVGLLPENIYKRTKLVTWASHGGRGFETVGDDYMPADVIKIDTNKKYFVESPSVVVFALENPAMDDTTTTEDTVMSEAEQVQLQYIDVVVEQAMMQFMGLVETGAETPWEDAAQLLRKVLEPDVFEETAAAWQSSIWRTFHNAAIQFSVPGNMRKANLSSGG